MFTNLGAWGTGKQTLEFDVNLLLLLDLDILLDDFFSLLDESLLESLDLLEEFPSLGVGTLELSPSVVVERVLKFLRECLYLEFLSHKLSLKGKRLLAEILNLSSLTLDKAELALKISDAELKELDVLKTLLVLELSLGEGRLENLDLLVEESQLVIPTNQLCSKDVTFVDSLLHLLLRELVLLGGVLDDVVQLRDLSLLLFNGFLCLLVLLDFSVQLGLDDV